MLVSAADCSARPLFLPLLAGESPVRQATRAAVLTARGGLRDRSREGQEMEPSRRVSTGSLRKARPVMIDARRPRLLWLHRAKVNLGGRDASW